jgi:hypothetical protein
MYGYGSLRDVNASTRVNALKKLHPISVRVPSVSLSAAFQTVSSSLLGPYTHLRGQNEHMTPETPKLVSHPLNYRIFSIPLVYTPSGREERFDSQDLSLKVGTPVRV